MQCYVIADCREAPAPSFFLRLERLVAAGAEWFQLRAKDLDDELILRVGKKMRAIIPRDQARFLINSRADIAITIGVDGVHLPGSGVPVTAVRKLSKALIVGRSCHSVEDCRRALQEQADYVLLGPVFPPRSKSGEANVQRADLIEAGRIGIPVFVLGGISRQSLEQLRDLPVAGIAAITLFMEDDDVEGNVAAVKAL